MLSSIYYGEIQSDKLVSWNENKDPYNILVENNRVSKLGGLEFLDIANKLFDNENPFFCAHTKCNCQAVMPGRFYLWALL